MSMIAGIDYSTRAVDVVWLDEDTDRAEWERFELKGTDAFDRTRSVPPLMMGRWSTTALGRFLVDDPWENTIAIGIEEPRGYNAGALYRVQGAILACLPRSVLVQPWLPSVWRKAVGLPGNASKDTVQAFVDVLRGQGRLVQLPAGTALIPTPDAVLWPQDACDAYCIALATRQALRREEAA